MEITSYEPGVPSWVDLGTPDPDRASAFYTALFGWEILEGPPEAGGYRICHLRGKPVAGLGPQMNPAAPPSWLTYVNVTNADAVADKVTAAGGHALMPPFDVMDVGRMGVFADPGGAVFALWQPGVHPGAAIVNEPGALCWNELVTNDVPGAIAFYRAVFDWDAETHGTGFEYTEFKLSGRSIAGCMPKPPMMPAEAPAMWGVYFGVADVDAAVAQATGLGAQAAYPPMEIEIGRFAGLTDPTGAFFQVMSFKAGAASG